MTCARTWHVWRCDGCGVEMRLEHGEWAEPALPTGWLSVFGWGLHACSAACQAKADADHTKTTRKRLIWDGAPLGYVASRPSRPVPGLAAERPSTAADAEFPLPLAEQVR